MASVGMDIFYLNMVRIRKTFRGQYVCDSVMIFQKYHYKEIATAKQILPIDHQKNSTHLVKIENLGSYCSSNS